MQLMSGLGRRKVAATYSITLSSVRGWSVTGVTVMSPRLRISSFGQQAPYVVALEQSTFVVIEVYDASHRFR